MTNLDLDAIEARAHEFCSVCDGSGTVSCWSPGGPCPEGQTVCETCGPCRQSDVPALVAALREARAEAARWEQAAIDAASEIEARWNGLDRQALVRERDEARAEAQRATAWHMEALDDLARAVCALDTSKAIASERRARVNRLVEAVERERAERLALTALLNAKQSWIDGAKVDLDGYDEARAALDRVRALADRHRNTDGHLGYVRTDAVFRAIDGGAS